MPGEYPWVGRFSMRRRTKLKRLERAAAKAAEHRVAVGRHEATRAWVLAARSRHPRGAALHAAAPRLGHRGKTGQAAIVARPGARASAGPLEDVAEDEAARRTGQRGQFPFGLGRQAAAGPAAPGLGLVAADVHGRLAPRRRAASAPGAAPARPGASAPRSVGRGGLRPAPRPSPRASTTAHRRSRHRRRIRRSGPSSAPGRRSRIRAAALHAPSVRWAAPGRRARSPA